MMPAQSGQVVANGPPIQGGTSPPVPVPGTLGGPISQKTMTKAERRELQERQRAAKQALKDQKNQSQTQNNQSQTQQNKTKAPATPQKPSSSTHSPQQSRPPVSSSRGGDARSAQQRRQSVSSSQRHADTSSTGGDAHAHDDPSRTRGLRIFSHFGVPKPKVHAIKGDIHPSIVRLGLLYSEFKICGANARCIAMLTAFKTVIQDYMTPANNTLSRHLMTYLSPQITHLVTARPMSVTMGNAIRQLKLEISGSDIDLPEQDAKEALCDKIDTYIRDRIIIADEVISDLACKKISDGDVVLTYARSSVVEKVLLRAYEEGKRFSVIVVDSRPMLEGKHLVRRLTSKTSSHGPSIPCTYALLSALPSLITEVTTVFLGAHSLHSNGAVYSRAGTAMVAMLAKQHNVPIVICCETYKFSDGIVLDGFGKNELVPPLPFLHTSFPSTRPPDSLMLQNKPNLEILNPLYDLTPPSCITAVVTEVGLIPPSSISSIPVALGRTVV